MSGIPNMAAASDSFDKGNYGDALGNLLIGYAKADLLIGGPLAEGVGVVTRTAFAGLGLGLDAVGDAIANWAGSYATERIGLYGGSCSRWRGGMIDVAQMGSRATQLIHSFAALVTSGERLCQASTWSASGIFGSYTVTRTGKPITLSLQSVPRGSIPAGTAIYEADLFTSGHIRV